MVPRTDTNTIYCQHLRVEGDTSKPLDERRVLPYAASDDKAEAIARRVIEELGFGPLHLGELAAVRSLSEPGDLLYNKQITLAETRQLMAER